MFKHLWLWLIANKSGYKKDKYDNRNFNVGIFGWFEYKAKNKEHIIPTISIKDQSGRNTCVFEGTITSKEIDESKELSVRSVVAFAKSMGWISGNGFSSLKFGQEVLLKFGALEINKINENFRIWEDWVNVKINDYKSLADEHKIQSYWQVSDRGSILKLLDDNRPLVAAIKWYTGFNQSGGFKRPWIIEKNIGLSIGGHAFAIIGYNLDYHGREVLICQNSYGSGWGDNGKFYIEMDYFIKNNYGVFTNLDMPTGVGKLLIDYNMRNIKAPNNSTVYFVQGGKKLPYPNWLTYLSFNSKEKQINIVSQQEIDQIPTGDMMDITMSSNWKFIKDVQSDKQLDKLLELILTK